MTTLNNKHPLFKGLPYIIGVCGPSCGGKSTVCQQIINRFKSEVGSITVLSQDRYYVGGNVETNYDEPKSINFDEMVEDLSSLINGEEIYAPVYDFATHSRKKEKELIKPAPIIIIEGILIFTNEDLCKLLNKKIFVTASKDVCRERRLKRDVEERGRDESEVVKRYTLHVEPSNKMYVMPTMEQSHITIWNNIDDHIIGLEILLDHLEKIICGRN